jgi:hypothetical protein
MSGMKKPPIKRKRGERCKGKLNIDEAWSRLPESQSERQVKIQFYVNKELRDRMKNVAPMLIEMEKNNEGGGIKRNTPGMFCEYCCKTVTTGLEQIIKTMLEQEKPRGNDAIAYTTHNNG